MITLVVPTRGRPDRFKQMLESARKTAERPHRLEVIAMTDKDDQTWRSYPRKTVKYVRSERPENMSELWDRGAVQATGDIIMLCADDVVFETQGWDEQVEQAFAEVPDKILMVYTATGRDERPILPFVSRKWVETAGFTTTETPGWFADEWIWSIAAELKRVKHLPDVMIRHHQFEEIDETYRTANARRLLQGGLQGMWKRFYSSEEVRRRDEVVAKLRAVMDTSLEVVPEPTPEWHRKSLEWNAEARVPERNADVLVTVHCYRGDEKRVRDWLHLYLHHGRPVLVMSPEDSPVTIEHPQVQNYHGGPRAYVGQKSLDRQRNHLEHLVTLPYDWFFMCDADSVCLSPDFPEFLFEDDSVLWALYANEWRPHKSPYPKIGLHPPYFVSKKALKKMLTAANKPEVSAHETTPFIDWYMLALAEESGVKHRNYPDPFGFTYPAWRFKKGSIPDNAQMGNDHEHLLAYDEAGDIPGDDFMADRVSAGAIFVHSIKHKPVMDRLETIARKRRVRNGKASLVSILVPFTPEKNSDHRERVWRWIEARWRATVPDAEIVVGVDPGTPPGPYSKTSAINDAYRRASGDVFVIADADAWLEPKAFHRAVDVARRTNKLVVPWRFVHRLSEEDTDRIIAGDPSAKVEMTPDMMMAAFNGPDPVTAGTLVVISRDAFETVEGMDPRFRGWGMEDVAFGRACETILGPNVYGNEEVISLYHPRPSLEQRGRVWDGEDTDVPVSAHPNLELAKLYDGAIRDPDKMLAIVRQHRLREAKIPLTNSMDALRQVIDFDAVTFIEPSAFFEDRSWTTAIQEVDTALPINGDDETFTVEIY